MPVTHRKRPTAINTKGSMTHCEVEFFAGHKKAANGNGGAEEEVLGFGAGLVPELPSGVGVASFFLRRGLLDEAIGLDEAHGAFS